MQKIWIPLLNEMKSKWDENARCWVCKSIVDCEYQLTIKTPLTLHSSNLLNQTKKLTIKRRARANERFVWKNTRANICHSYKHTKCWVILKRFVFPRNILTDWIVEIFHHISKWLSFLAEAKSEEEEEDDDDEESESVFHLELLNFILRSVCMFRVFVSNMKCAWIKRRYALTFLRTFPY